MRSERNYKWHYKWHFNSCIHAFSGLTLGLTLQAEATKNQKKMEQIGKIRHKKKSQLLDNF
jgi:hypothetical protein